MMKLVDILARELKAWFEQYDCLSQLRHDGSIINGRGFDGVVLARLEIAEDTHPAGVIVTREQWQAAVNALNVPKNGEWTGEGLPPVGTVCEWTHCASGIWREAKVNYIGCVYVIFANHSGDDEQHYYLRDISFRPIRTAEQIAAEEREQRLVRMSHSYQDATGKAPCSYVEEAFRALDQEGYRKQEQK